jgi:hypothetical protein
MAALRMCGHFLGGWSWPRRENEQSIAQGDYAAKVSASIINASILLMFSYSFFHWIIFE